MRSKPRYLSYGVWPPRRETCTNSPQRQRIGTPHGFKAILIRVGRRAGLISVASAIVIGAINAVFTSTVAQADDLTQKDSTRPNLTTLTDGCPAPSEQVASEQRRHALEHYNRGAVLYEQGDYEAAIDEFVASYCDTPHPQMFFNIGQAFERQLDFETAVSYFERFIQEASPQAANLKRARVRVRVLKRLPARVRVATVPPGATVELLRGGSLAASGSANEESPVLVKGGRYTLAIEAPGYQPIKQTVELSIGQPYSYYFQLEKLRGILHINVEPSSARIFIDNRLVGLGSYRETIDIGRYNVRVEADKRKSITRDLTVSPGRTTSEVFKLAPPQPTGRWELVGAGTIVGFYSAIAASPVAGDNTLTEAGLLLGGLGFGFGASLVAIPKDIRWSTSSYIMTTSLAGAIELGSLSSLFLCKSEHACSNQVVAASAMGLLSGAAFGAFTSGRFHLDSGDAAILNSGVLWGTGFGQLFFLAFDENPDLSAPLLLAGINLGLVTAVTIGKRVTASRRRIALIDLAGVGGTISGFALASALDARGERIAHSAIAGAALGLLTGALLTRFFDEPDNNTSSVIPVIARIRDNSGLSLTTVGASMRF